MMKSYHSHYKPLHIQLHIISECQLRCEACAKTIPYGYMDFDTFKTIVDKCVDFGFKNFELTPTVGDILLDREMMQKITYLHSKPVDSIFFFTNLLNLNEDMITQFNRFDKLNIRVSVYGDDRDVYKLNTGVDCFDRFIEKFSLLGNSRKGLVSELNIRYKGWKMSNLKKVTNPLYAEISRLILSRKVTEHAIIDESFNDNWNEIVESNMSISDSVHRDRGGVCRSAIISNSIQPNGDITLCGCVDVNNNMIIGNIFKQTLEEIYGHDSLYHKLISDQHKGVYRSLCANCTMYDTFNKQDSYVHKAEN